MMASDVVMSGNIPLETKEITRHMEEAKEQVEGLKNSLEPTQEVHEQLEEGLRGYQAAQDPTSINRCPPELLNIIFRLVIRDNPTHVRRLLLVCKYWYGLVVQDAQMWNTISVKFPDDYWNVQSWANTARPFLRKCLEHSQPALLEVSLDFGHLRTFLVERQLQLEATLFDDRRLISAPKYDTLGDPCSGDPQYERTSVCKPDHALDLIKELVGPNGKHMTRWKSLEVTFPFRELALKIWDMIVHPFPNLMRISFIYFPRVGEDPSIISVSPSPFLQVEHLALDVGDYPKILALFPPTLRNLSVKATFEYALTFQLSRFTHLSVLTLNEGIPKMPTEPSSHLSLPHLQELNLIGTFQPMVAMELDLPRLRRLMIEWSWRFPVSRNLPLVRPSVLQWAPHDKPQGKGEYKLAMRVMQAFLLHFTSATTFSVPHHMKDALLDLLKELSSDGLLSTSEWETLVFHEDGDVVETVKISEV